MKLRANWLNGLSVATFAVGTLASTSRALFEPRLQTSDVLTSSSVALICLFIAWRIHLLAYNALKSLDP
ncbi:hypothetical protein [Jiella flava]|uniref:Uncharacterized protein n=1 Tax=Jiella flava TaxID=2816857 RepID=A0A939FYX3_9HYPH|nr:hypothetical protein [Jiella flava]MBO0662755.1 hypothetical protein [Jiella flava]